MQNLLAQATYDSRQREHVFTVSLLGLGCYPEGLEILHSGHLNLLGLVLTLRYSELAEV